MVIAAASGAPSRRLKVHVRRGGIEQIDAANDCRDALLGIVDHDGEVIGRQAVAAHDDVVAGRGAEIDLGIALQAVVERSASRDRRARARQHRRLAPAASRHVPG